jgi:acetoin utilization protein AcuB
VRARDIMTPNPVTVSVQATVAQAAETLRDLAIRHLPVVRGGALVGILSDRDLAALENWTPGDLEDVEALRARGATPVSRVMSTDVSAVDPETPVGEIISTMIEGRIGAVPVVDPGTGQVVGIVSYVDILRAVQGLIEDA